MFISKVCQALEKAKVDYALVGGYAVALHGAPRGTIDIDIALTWSLENISSAEKALQTLGLQSQLPVDAQMIFNFRDEYIQNRNLIAWNFFNPTNPMQQVDIIITYNLSASNIKTLKTQAGKVKLLTKEALIKMKQDSGRPQDHEDIRVLKKL